MLEVVTVKVVESGDGKGRDDSGGNGGDDESGDDGYIVT